MTRSILIVTGIAREAAIVEGPGIHAVRSGADTPALRRALASLDPKDFAAVISFGLAGGLHADHPPGRIAIGRDVIAGGMRWSASPEIVAALERALKAGGHDHAVVSFAGVDEAVMQPAHKRALHEKTGAHAVDMESHAAAAYAQTHGLPFGILRAICDPVTRALPEVAATALKPDGSVDYLAVAKGLARNPFQIPSLIATGRDANAAFEALRRCRGGLGAGLGLGFLAAHF
ncbi:MAG: phosphorylase [Pseudorhodoplanes sp.]|nr:phosphorylase [Pseudorhodoplanes sp.]